MTLTLDSEMVPDDGQSHHIAATWDGSTWAVYVDGERQ